MTGKIKVLIVDDSAVVRKLASEALGSDPQIEVVGAAGDPYEAQTLIGRFRPDVVTLDLEMPRMDGLTFLALLMERRPLPVIVMSSLTQRGSEFGLEALRLGAIDILPKPSGAYSFGELGRSLIEKVKVAAGARPRAGVSRQAAPPAPRRDARPVDGRSVILLGASTGGTEALREVLTRLPANMPGIAVVQHIPAVFSKNFAKRLNNECELEVREAVDNEELEPGTVLIAPGGFHLVLRRSGDRYQVGVTGGPLVWHQRPAVDILFKSAADCGAGPHAIAGVLTGMGKDGAQGLLSLREKGATTFAQDQETSAVYGMPKVAWESGAAQVRLPLGEMADFIFARCRARIDPVAATHPE